MERFLSLWFVLCYVGMVALCIVNVIHALQMLTDRHDSGVHYAALLFAVAALDLVAKLIALTFVDASFSKSGWSRVCCVGFFIVGSLGVFLIGVLRLICSHKHLSCSDKLILWLDPALTIVAAVLMALSVIQPLIDNGLVLILAVPRHIDVEILERKFRTKVTFAAAPMRLSNVTFLCEEVNVMQSYRPHLIVDKDLKIYQQSRNEVNVSVRVRHRLPPTKEEPRTDVADQLTVVSNQIKDFFASQGANGRIFVQPEFYIDDPRGQ